MNQDLKGFNQNNYNIQGDNELPNSEALNGNQNFYNGSSQSQQASNMYEQPVKETNGQQPIMPHVEPAYGNFNNKPKKNLGLIFAVAIVATIAAAIIFIPKFLNVDNTEDLISNDASDKQNTNSKSSESIEKILASNENIIMTSYVDSYSKFVVDYPVFYFKDDGSYSSLRVFSNGSYPMVKINTILGGSMSIFYPSEPDSYLPFDDEYTGSYTNAKDFYDNYYLPQIKTDNGLYKYLWLLDLSSCSKCVLKESENIGTFNYNNLTWERYNIIVSYGSDEREYEVWITMKNNIPYVVKFNILGKNENPFNENLEDSEWGYLVDNAVVIRESIIKSFKFCDDKQELLNKKELSVLRANFTDSLREGIVTQENSIYEHIYFPATIISGSHMHGFSYKNIENIGIDEVFSTINNKPLPTPGVPFSNFGGEAGYGYDAIVTADNWEESYKLSNKYIGEYEVKYYDLSITSSNGYGTKAGAYVFRTSETYGFILSTTTENRRLLINALDYAVKNFRFWTDDRKSYRWNLEDFLNDN